MVRALFYTEDEGSNPSLATNLIMSNNAVKRITRKLVMRFPLQYRGLAYKAIYPVLRDLAKSHPLIVQEWENDPLSFWRGVTEAMDNPIAFLNS